MFTGVERLCLLGQALLFVFMYLRRPSLCPYSCWFNSWVWSHWFLELYGYNKNKLVEFQVTPRLHFQLLPHVTVFGIMIYTKFTELFFISFHSKLKKIYLLFLLCGCNGLKKGNHWYNGSYWDSLIIQLCPCYLIDSVHACITFIQCAITFCRSINTLAPLKYCVETRSNYASTYVLKMKFNLVYLHKKKAGLQPRRRIWLCY